MLFLLRSKSQFESVLVFFHGLLVFCAACLLALLLWSQVVPSERKPTCSWWDFSPGSASATIWKLTAADLCPLQSSLQQVSCPCMPCDPRLHVSRLHAVQTLCKKIIQMGCVVVISCALVFHHQSHPIQAWGT